MSYTCIVGLEEVEEAASVNAAVVDKSLWIHVFDVLRLVVAVV